jgi:hypothetical protein
VLTASCSRGPDPGKGFRLPEGDAERGRTAFVDLGCIQCHTVSFVDLPALSQPRVIDVKIGGEVQVVTTYGQLVTSIINPSHVVSKSYKEEYPEMLGSTMMPNYNGTMTVQQLCDIVAFLHPCYEVLQPDYRDVSDPHVPLYDYP